jgi:hypothetical protein
MYKQRTGLIIIDKISLKTVRWKKWDIIKFKNPSWNVNDTNKIKLEKIKDNLSYFYENKIFE